MRIVASTAQRPKRGERVCGDAVFVREANGLVVVADGLGHGEEAAAAAIAFTDVASSMLDSSPLEILQAAGPKLAATRGAVALVARFDCATRRTRIAGVGNIEVRSRAAAAICPISAAGIVGRKVRIIREFEYGIAPGDLVVFMSDGISRRVELNAYAGMEVAAVAAGILRDHGVFHDDATCVAVRVQESEHERS